MSQWDDCTPSSVAGDLLLYLIIGETMGAGGVGLKMQKVGEMVAAARCQNLLYPGGRVGRGEQWQESCNLIACRVYPAFLK